MKKILVNTIWAVGGIALTLFCLSACTRELDVQQAYDFSLEVMPVQNSIAKGKRLKYAVVSKEVVALPIRNTRSVTSSRMVRVA